MPEQKPKRQLPFSWIFYLVAIAVAVLGLIGSKPSADQINHKEGTIDQTKQPNDLILIDNQVADSNIVEIQQVEMEKSGFVVIYDSTQGLENENIGVSELIVGNQQNIQIKLNTALVQGQVYYAVLHYDSDGNGVFSTNRDYFVKDSKQNIVMTSFIVR